MDDATTIEFANLCSVIVQHDELEAACSQRMLPNKRGHRQPQFLPKFASQPASKFEQDPAPIIAQRAIPGEHLEEIWTGSSKDSVPREATLSDRRYAHKGLDDLYIPEIYPWTHTHIEQLGSWPQRLLHVPTMTSHSWQPGNMYGGQHEPRYRAISYTWGRWRLKPGQKPKVKNLDITVTGVDPWPIPRIRPDHFDVGVFRQVLDEIRKPVKVITHQPQKDSMLEDLPATEFVWLDLACIDQRRGPVAALEVGRQADIFRRASGVSIWLNHSGKDSASLARLRSFMSNLIYGSFLCPPWKIENQEWQVQMLERFRELLCDPWFTSLWTLQEAFLAQDAYFLSALGTRITMQSDKFFGSSTFTLSLLTDACRGLLKESKKLSEDHHQFVAELTGWMDMSNLANLVRNGSPLALLSAAKYRFVSEDQDHIYGIMQVFRYRLGSSNPGADPNREYTRAELSDQLGAALFRDRPVQSQLHAFIEPVERGKGWHVSPSSAILSCYIEPLLPLQENREPVEESTPRCRLSTKEVGGALFGFFEGLACRFTQIWIPWKQLNDATVRIHKNATGIDGGLGCPLPFVWPRMSIN